MKTHEDRANQIASLIVGHYGIGQISQAAAMQLAGALPTKPKRPSGQSLLACLKGLAAENKIKLVAVGDFTVIE